MRFSIYALSALATGAVAAECPDYNQYAQQPHAPYSGGPLKLPYMRPSEECRTFKSPAVEVSFVSRDWAEW